MLRLELGDCRDSTFNVESVAGSTVERLPAVMMELLMDVPMKKFFFPSMNLSDGASHGCPHEY
jgi:hypothetical protein